MLNKRRRSDLGRGGDHSCTTSGRTWSSLRGVDGANRRNAGALGPSWIASTGSRGTNPSRRKTWVGTVKFALSKETMPDSFNGTDRMKVSDWESQDVELPECRRLRARGRHPGVDRAGTGGCTRGQCLTGSQGSEDGPDRHWITRGCQGTCSPWWAIAQMGRRIHQWETEDTKSEWTHGDGYTWKNVPVTSATAQGFMERSLEIPRAKTTSDVSSAIQILEELVRKYEEHRDKKYDNDLK